MEKDSVTMQQRIVGLKRAAPYLRMYKNKVFVVKIGGEVWSARSYDEDEVIEAGDRVEVLKIDGATALVAK